MPKVSVIVPVYKAEKQLSICVNSILNQTLEDFELILIDDGSPDSSGEICDTYCAQDPRIRVIHQKNSGVSTARNVGLNIAAGKYVTFVDSDDCIRPMFLEHLVAEIERRQCDIMVSGYLICKKNDSLSVGTLEGTVEPRVQASKESLYSQALQEGLLNTCWGKLYKTSSIHGRTFPEDICWGEDTAFVFSCIQADTRVGFCPCHEYQYRYSDDGLDKRFDLKKPQYMLRYYQEIFLFTDRIQPGGDTWLDAVNIKISQEIMRGIFALMGQKIPVRDKIRYLKTLFSNPRVNHSFSAGTRLDSNPRILKVLSSCPRAGIWLLFVTIKNAMSSVYYLRR